MHTCIHNYSWQNFRQDYNLDTHAIHVVCVTFCHELRDLQTPVLSIIEEAFQGSYNYSHGFCLKTADKSLRNGILTE